MRRTAFAFVAVLLLVAGIAWLGTESGESVPALDARDEVPAAAALTSAPQPRAAEPTEAAPPAPQSESKRVPPIRGLVHAIGGPPIAGALVELVRPNRDRADEVLATARTGADGRFSVDAGRWRLGDKLAASAPGCARCSRPAAPGDDLDLALPVGGVLRGRVVDADTGQPIAGARVAAAAEYAVVHSFADSATSAADGTYEFAHVLPWTINVSAHAQGYARHWVRVVVAAGATTVHDVALSHAGTVTGTVTRDGRPEVGARVAVGDLVGTNSDTVTGPDGSFRLTGLARSGWGGPDVLSVTAAGPVRMDVVVKPARGPEVRVDVDLSDCWTIRGVVRRGGAGVSGAQVGRSLLLGSAGAVQDLVDCGADGAFVIAANERDPCELTVIDEFGSVIGTKVPRPNGGRVAADVVIELPEPATIVARAVDDRGAAVAGAWIATDWAGPRVRAGADGVLSVRTTQPYVYVAIGADGFVSSDRQMSVKPRTTTDLGDVALSPNDPVAPLTGRVHTVDGTPLASVAVSATWPKSTVRTLTAADGTFRLQGPAEGAVSLWIVARGWNEWRREKVAAGSTDLDVTLEPSPRPRTALILRADGSPARIVEIACTNASHSQTVAESADGRVDLPPPVRDRPSEVEFVCGDEVARVEIAAKIGTPDGVEVRLVPGAFVRGHVVGRGGVQVKNGVVVALRGDEPDPADSRRRAARCDADGRFVVGPLVPGAYVLSIRTDDWPVRQLAVEARSGETTNVDETLGSGDVRVRVVDSEGAPVSGGSARLLRPDGSPAFYRSSMTRADNDLGEFDESGVLLVRWLDLGRYRIAVQLTGRVTPPGLGGDVEIRDGETADLEIRLPR